MLNPTRDSLLYWYSEIQHLDIPKPRTVVQMLTDQEFSMTYDGMPHSLTTRVGNLVDKYFELPVFLRTDLASGKHSWKNSCFYDSSGKLWEHLLEVVTFNHIADIMGLQFKAIVIREFIPMETAFTAFWGDMPINPERRYFVKDGKVICHHPYWIEAALKQSHKEPSVSNWRELLQGLNAESPEEIKQLTEYAEQAGKVLPGNWSIDFCKAADGRWILIDCATAEKSWHPECPHINLFDST